MKVKRHGQEISRGETYTCTNVVGVKGSTCLHSCFYCTCSYFFVHYLFGGW